jgi:hypothetical protein
MTPSEGLPHATTTKRPVIVNGRVRPQRVVDVILFLNEVELLEIRLHELARDVSDFVIVESLESVSGFPRSLVFDDNRPRLESMFGRRLLNRVTYHVCSFPRTLKIDNVVLGMSPQKQLHWAREYHQRNVCMKEALAKVQPPLDGDTIVLMGDLDEIPSELAVRSLRSCDYTVKRTTFGAADSDALVAFRQKRYHFNFHCVSANMYDWTGTIAASYKTALKMGLQNMRECRWKPLPPGSFKVDIEHGGWHFSNFDFQNGTQLWDKYRSFSESQAMSGIEGDQLQYWKSVMKQRGDVRSNTHCNESDLFPLPRLVERNFHVYKAYLSASQITNLTESKTGVGHY